VNIQNAPFAYLSKIRCVAALQSGDAEALDRTSESIRGRSHRICNVVSSEMDNYEPGFYTERVLEAIRLLRDCVMPNFAQKVDQAAEEGGLKEVDQNEFIDASRYINNRVEADNRFIV